MLLKPTKRKKMNWEIKEHEGGLTAIISGRLDTPSAVKAQQEILPLLENADKEIILDCEQLQYISSSSDAIKTVFMMTGFVQLFELR